MGPYRMVPPKLEELRRQLKELLDTGSSNHPRLPMARRSYFRRSMMGQGTSRKLDLRSGYYQVRIAEGDEPKTTCVTSNTLREHVEHLRKVFKILRQNELYVKKEKCSFAKEEVSFLGHRIGDGKLMMDDSKVKAIQEWDPPTKVTSTPIFPWCQQAFEDLKKAVIEEPVLALPDHTKVFEVHTDASDFAIGGVLLQERHPIAFESRNLKRREEALHSARKGDDRYRPLLAHLEALSARGLTS
ncbi:hypothetical protein CK203_026067 [Vitis vinifera]|uniref:Uncharacterized protein n=1 Tax=Vitis vinifera TaxID=29760 RepID=A0A438IJ60_VITVI|nr:hypothetical protein CK203_026067 [Vitis vinifera]